MPEALGERMATLETQMRAVNKELFGNGQPGLAHEVRRFMAVQNDRSEQSDREREQSDKRNRLYIAVGGAVLTAAHIGWDAAKPAILALLHH